MWKELDPAIYDLTPEAASQHFHLPTFVGDRDHSTKRGKLHTAWLTSKLEDGKFMSPHWAIAELDGKVYRVDGGHSSAALYAWKGEFPVGKKINMRRFICETADDFADLYSQFDPKNSLRTFMDKLRAHMAVDSGLQNVTRTACKNAVKGISFYESHCGEEERLDEDEQIGLAHSEGEFIKWCQQFIGRRHLQTASVVAAIYATWKVDPAASNIFWSHVRDEDHPNNKDATRTICTFLRVGAKEEKFKSRAYYAKCIHAWNAWLDGSKTDLKYFPRKPLPKPASPKKSAA